MVAAAVVLAVVAVLAVVVVMVVVALAVVAVAVVAVMAVMAAMAEAPGGGQGDRRIGHALASTLVTDSPLPFTDPLRTPDTKALAGKM